MKKIIICILAAVVVIAGVVLFINGLNYDIPSKSFSFSSIKEYVGGDAYNGMIEASLRGGQISGAMASKAIYTCGGVVTASIGILILAIGIKGCKEECKTLETQS